LPREHRADAAARKNRDAKPIRCPPRGDEEHDPERYMATWLSSIREISSHDHIDDEP